MAIRFYVVPAVTVTFAGQVVRVPQYVMTAAGKMIAGDFAGIDYGADPTFLIAADVTNSEHASLAAHTDVLAAPPRIGRPIGGMLATVRARLAAHQIPEVWVAPGMTWQTVLREVWRLCFLMGRYQPYGRFFDTTTLNDSVSTLSPEKLERLVTAAASLGLDTSGITGALTIRQALTHLGDQITVPAVLGGVSL